VSLFAFFDVIALAVAAPIMLLIGVPASGYAIGAAAWIVVRAAGLGIDRVIDRADAQTQIGLRMAHMFGRLFVLAIAVIIARNSGGRDAGLTCLAVVVFAYTMSLAVAAATRPMRSR
jgi:hypothetical protein